jgi:hypothetical protein
MATVQSFLTYSNATVTAYKNWAQGIGSALSTLGWSLVADTAGVTWANVVSLTNIPQYTTPLAGIITTTAWSAGTTYTGGTLSNTSNSNFNVVTNSGLTYACVLSTGNPASLTSVQALQNSAATLTVTAVAASSAGVAVYTVSSGVTSAMIGQQFVVSIGGSNLLANNAGTFVCTNTSGTTSITFGNPIATAQASVTGGAPGAQAISSTSVISFIGNNNTSNWTNLGSNNAPTNGFSTVNALVGHSLVVSGWTGGATGNNGTYTVTSNAAATLVSNNAVFCATFTGTNATQATVSVVEGTAPASDPIHWLPYNYEIWKSNGPLSSTAPIYMKIVYAAIGGGNTAFFNGSATVQTPALIMDIGTTNPLTTQIGGNHISDFLFGFNSATGVGASYECDFCAPNGDELAWIMWRNAAATNTSIPFVLFIDRTKDQSGNPLSTFFTVGMTSSNTAPIEYTVFNQQTGGVINYQPSGGNKIGWTFPIFPLTGGAYQGLTPVLPIFPIPGYVANPVLMAVAMKRNDFTDGQLVNAILYGGSHTFLMSKGNICDQTQLGDGFPGIRWE